MMTQSVTTDSPEVADRVFPGFAAIAAREEALSRYWARDPIGELRTWWRAMTVRHLLHLQPGDRILELGCGNGVLTEALVRATREECSITAASFCGGLGIERLKHALPAIGTVVLDDFPGDLVNQ